MAASGSDLRVAITPETVFGTTPATPTFAILRTTNGGLKTDKGTVVSDERQFHQNVVDELQVAQDVSGSYDFEMSHASFDTLIEAVLGGTWATNAIKNGITKRSFTVEEFLELGATDTYRRFDGVMVNSMSLSITAREKITGQFGFVGRKETLATAIVSGATYTQPNSEQIMTGSGSVGTIAIGSISPAPLIRSLSLEVNRNLRRINALANIHSEGMNAGMCDVTGQVEVYFQDNATYQAALNHETAAITATIGHDANKKYTVSIPRARLGNAQLVAGGNGSDIMATIPFRGTLSTDHSIQITRAVA